MWNGDQLLRSGANLAIWLEFKISVVDIVFFLSFLSTGGTACKNSTHQHHIFLASSRGHIPGSEYEIGWKVVDINAGETTKAGGDAPKKSRDTVSPSWVGLGSWPIKGYLLG